MRGFPGVTRGFALIAAWPCALQAQQSLPALRLSDLLGETMSLSITPSYGRVSLGGRSAFDARVAWPGRPDGRYTLLLGLEVAGVRFGLNSYVRSGFDAQVRRRAGVTTWLGVAGRVGNGTGPRQMFQVSSGAQAGAFSLEQRTSWLEVTDSLGTASTNGALAIVGRTYTDAEATATRRFGSMRMALTAGNRFGSLNATRTWAFATLTVPVRPRIDLSLASGWRPDQPERAQPRGAFAQISLRFDLRANLERAPAQSSTDDEEESALIALPLDVGYRLRLRAASAQSVELKGDLTNWDVKNLHKAGAGYWELEVEAKPGVYLINIRIDGRLWTVPAGLVAVSDSFGGLVGVLNLQ